MDERVYQDLMAWRMDAAANLARASGELKGPVYAKERAELLLMLRIARQSMEPKVSHAETVVKFLSRGANAPPKPGDERPGGAV